MSLPPNSILTRYPILTSSSFSSLLLHHHSLGIMVQELVETLRNEAIPSQIWLKVGPLAPWQHSIARYQQQMGELVTLYLCQETGSEHIPEAILFQLEADSHLANEAFLVVQSAQLTLGIVAQCQTLQRSYFQVWCSFDPLVAIALIQEIQKHIAISDTTPKELLLDCLPEPLPGTPAPLLTTFWLNTLQSLELSQTLAATPSESHPEVFFNPQLLQQILSELSTPLTRMKTALGLLTSPQLKVSQRERYLSLLHQECDRQQSLLKGLRSLLDLDQPPPEDTPHLLYLDQMLPGIVSTYQPLAMEKGIQLGYTLPIGLPAIACAEPWFRSIILNLLNNSLQFTPPQGKVSVTASLQGEYVQLAFQDTGIGIAPQNLAKIFDSFYRGPNQGYDEQPKIGAGLGLTVVQRLLIRCGGSISVQSQLNRGSTFKVLFPISRRE